MSDETYSQIMRILELPILFVATIFSAIRCRMLGRHAIGVVYESENGTLISGTADMFVGGNLGFRGHYEKGALNSLLRLVEHESRVLVLGPHVGAFAIPIAKKVREVVAYEANPETFRLLQYNLKLNNVDNFTAFNLAAGDRAGKIEFMTSGVNSGASGRQFGSSPGLTLERFARIEVEMVRLVDHLADPRFDLVLMDIEGSEYFALLGMAPVLGTCSYLQFEYLPAVLRRNGVTDENLAAVLGDHFSELRVQGTELFAERKDFLKLLRQLRHENRHVDLLAVAARASAHAKHRTSPLAPAG